ncbi:MAG: alpha/beta hydrolase [Xenococcus sp. (in: cyanobacteria)]
MTNTTKSQFHSLLIGIDNYESIATTPRIYKNLGGCVRDIRKVADYLDKLRKNSQISQGKTWTLTAPVKETNELGSIKAAESNLLPTYANIVEAFDEITAAANPGDQVYIHYSGHGGRAKTIYGNLKEGVQHDESIVPMDVADPNGRHLRDVEITTLLKRITDKKCILTVIFDSCHSGDATRGEYTARGSKEIDEKDRNIESLVAPDAELIANWQQLNKSDGVWLPQDNEYVFMGACLDTEEAFEYRIDGEKCGALTYWMLNTLTALPPGSSYQMLFERVNAKIRSELREKQTPVFLGQGNRVIFGDETILYQYSVSVANVTKSAGKVTGVELKAGIANGLGIGARFAIYPLGAKAKDLSDPLQRLALVEVTESLALKSTAEVLSIKDDVTIELGSQAVMLAPPTDLVKTVNIYPIKAEDEYQLPSDLLAQQDIALDEIRKAIDTDSNGWLKEATPNVRKEDFQVSVARDGTYEIASGFPIDNLTPAVSIGDPDGAKEIVKRLIHLAKYEAVQELKNPYSDVVNGLEVKLIPQNRSKTEEIDANSNNTTLMSGDIVTLHIKNISEQEINVVVLDLEPTWEVSQIPLRPGSIPKFYRFSPGQEINQKLRLKLPDKPEYQKKMETIKVFAMYGEADYRWLELPSLDEPLPSAKSRGILSEPENKLEELFAAFGADSDAAPPVTRAEAIFEPGEEWGTKEIQITVSRNIDDSLSTVKSRSFVEEVPSNIEVPVYFATDRNSKETDSEAIKVSYGGKRNPESKLEFGLAKVSIPAEHRMGYLERPRWWNLQFREDINKYVVLLELENYDREYFQTKLREDIKNSLKPEILLFIHGYSVSFQDALLRTAQISHDLEFPGPAILYSWPSAAKKLLYTNDETNIEWTIPHLKEFLQFLLTTVGAKSLNAIAHSMGNRALARAIKESDFSNLGDDAASLRHIIFAAPDIDAEVFKQFANEFKQKADSFTLYSSSKDIALKLSKAFHGFPRAGDSGENLVVVDGVNTIDASSVDTSLIGHSYFGDNRSVISDIYYLLKQNLPPNERACLEQIALSNLTYWFFRA